MGARRNLVVEVITSSPHYCESCRVFYASKVALRHHYRAVHKPKRFYGKRIYFDGPMPRPDWVVLDDENDEMVSELPPAAEVQAPVNKMKKSRRPVKNTRVKVLIPRPPKDQSQAIPVVLSQAQAETPMDIDDANFSENHQELKQDQANNTAHILATLEAPKFEKNFPNIQEIEPKLNEVNDNFDKVYLLATETSPLMKIVPNHQDIEPNHDNDIVRLPTLEAPPLMKIVPNHQHIEPNHDNDIVRLPTLEAPPLMKIVPNHQHIEPNHDNDIVRLPTLEAPPLMKIVPNHQHIEPNHDNDIVRLPTLEAPPLMKIVPNHQHIEPNHDNDIVRLPTLEAPSLMKIVPNHQDIEPNHDNDIVRLPTLEAPPLMKIVPNHQDIEPNHDNDIVCMPTLEAPPLVEIVANHQDIELRINHVKGNILIPTTEQEQLEKIAPPVRPSCLFFDKHLNNRPHQSSLFQCETCCPIKLYYSQRGLQKHYKQKDHLRQLMMN